jgi:hypothetical protein
MKVVITGESHTAALFMGQKQLEKEGHKGAAANIVVRPLGGGHLLREPFFIDRGDHAEIVTPQFRARFERLPLDGAENQDTIYGLCAPLHTARVWRDLDWSRFAPLGHAKAETPISKSMLRDVILEDQKYILAFIDIFVRTGVHIFAIEAPRPFRHHQALKHVREDVALAVDAAYREILRAELSARSVPVVSVPQKCLDVRGFTLEQYGRAADPHHGNMKFGRLMMLEIEAFLTQFADKAVRIPASREIGLELRRVGQK